MKIKRFTPPPEVAYVTYAVYIHNDFDGIPALDPKYHQLHESDGVVEVVNMAPGRPSLSSGQWLVQLSDDTHVVAGDSRFRQYVDQCGQEWPDD